MRRQLVSCFMTVVSLAGAGVLLASTGASAHAQSGPAYGHNLSGTYEVWSTDQRQLCTLELTSQWGTVRETFELEEHNCPAPFDGVGRWSRDMRGLQLHNSVFSTEWTGRRPNRDALFFAGEAGDGQQYALRPIAGNAVATLAGQGTTRPQDQPVNRRDVPGDWSIRTRHSIPYQCTLTLLIDENNRNRVIPQDRLPSSTPGEGGCRFFQDAATWRRAQGELQLGDRAGNIIWSGRYGRDETGRARAEGRDRGAVWILERQGDASASVPPRLDNINVLGRWSLQFDNYSCDLELYGNGRIRPANQCQAPGRMMSRWSLNGTSLSMWDSLDNRAWDGEIIAPDRIIGSGVPGTGYGFPPRRIPDSELRR